MTPTSHDTSEVLRIRGASLGFGDRTLWSNLELSVAAGEFVAVLGPNGAGKSSLFRAILGRTRVDAGRIELPCGRERVGYIPQQRPFPPGTLLRGRDLVRFGVDGTRFGLPIPSRRARARVDELLEVVGATDYARAPMGALSGGEQQRLRIAQALAVEPALVLADEPLASLDLHHQRVVAGLLESIRHERGAGVLLVTHDINPVLRLVDRVLYLAAGGFRIGTPDEVLRSEVLSELYDTPVEVIRSKGRVFVLGTPETPPHPHGGAHA